MIVNSSSAKVSCRFLLGGEEGRLKYAPPANFSPLFESLLPTQNLRIDPGFYMGDLNKAILSGPLDIDDKIAFVPKPVDTSTVSNDSECLSSKEPNQTKTRTSQWDGCAIWQVNSSLF